MSKSDFTEPEQIQVDDSMSNSDILTLANQYLSVANFYGSLRVQFTGFNFTICSIILAFMKNEVFQSRVLPVSAFLLVLGLFSAIAVSRLSTVVNFHWNAHTRISDIVRKSDARVNAEYIKVEEKGRDFERRNVAGIGWVTGMPLHVFFPLNNFVIPAGLVVTLRFFLKFFISRFFHNFPRTNHSENNRSQSKQPRRPARSPGRYPRFRGRYRARDRSRLPCPAP